MPEIPARQYGKVQRDRRKTADQPNPDLEKLDIFNTYWAQVVTQDGEYFDKYTVTIYADEDHSVVLVNNIEAFSVDMHRYAVNEYVRVFWETSRSYAIIFMRSETAWAKLTKDWKPNEAAVFGNPSSSLGVVQLEDRNTTITISLNSSGHAVAYAPFRKDDIVVYHRWPFEVATTWSPSGKLAGIMYGWNQIPVPTALDQVLVCSGFDTDNKASISWRYVRTHDRVRMP